MQGILGSTPWNALVFLTLYFQLIGMSDFAASALMALFLGGTAVGGWVGGYVGDKAALVSPHHGRIGVCQLSVAAGVPLSLLILKVGLLYLSGTRWPEGAWRLWACLGRHGWLGRVDVADTVALVLPDHGCDEVC